MKVILAVASVVLFSSVAQAGYNPSEYQCSELQTVLDSEGMIMIEDSWGWDRPHYSNSDSCDRYKEEPNISYEKAADGWCLLGYVCNKKSDHKK